MHLIFLSSLILAVTCAAFPARAQLDNVDIDSFDSPADEYSVLGRSRPEYDPKGIPLGGFRLFPSAGVAWSYDDNVLRTDTGAKSDTFVDISTRMELRSAWTRHFAGAYAAASYYGYDSLSSEDRTQWVTGASGRADILTGVTLSGTASYLSTYESRTSRDQVGAAEPTPYQETNARLVFAYNPARLGFQLGAAFRRYDFDPTKLVPAFGGGTMDNRDRDRNGYSTFVTALYEFSPGYGVFIRPSYERLVYDRQGGRASGRDSDGYRIDGGINLLLSELIVGEAYLGYLRHDFSGTSFSDVDGLDFGAGIRWFPSPLATLHLNASRTPNPTTLAGASTSDERNVELGIDYEVLRNLILQGDISYTNTRFEGIARRDEDMGMVVALRYLVNPLFTVQARVVRSVRSSTDFGRGFDDDVLSVGVTAHL